MTNEFNLNEAKEVITSCVTGCNQATTHVITANGPVCKRCLALNIQSSEKVLANQREEEIIEIDENGVVHGLGEARTLKSTVLRDPEGELGAFVGQKVICNEHAGTITKVCDGELSGMVEVRLERGSVCVPYAFPDCYSPEEDSDLPDYLKDDAPFVLCSVCERKSWSMWEEGKTCGMPQPDKSRCIGVMEPEPEFDRINHGPFEHPVSELDETFIRNLEARHMSSWGDAEMNRYNELTGQNNE